jgi:hypothetical protein
MTGLLSGLVTMISNEEKYIGYCTSCGKRVKEYCHDYLCLKCCSKLRQLENEMYKD